MGRLTNKQSVSDCVEFVPIISLRDFLCDRDFMYFGIWIESCEIPYRGILRTSEFELSCIFKFVIKLMSFFRIYETVGVDGVKIANSLEGSVENLEIISGLFISVLNIFGMAVI